MKKKILLANNEYFGSSVRLEAVQDYIRLTVQHNDKFVYVIMDKGNVAEIVKALRKMLKKIKT